MRLQPAWVAVSLAAVFLTRVAGADQAAYIRQEAANRAAELINEEMEIRHFCKPCGDETWRPEVVTSKAVEPAGYEKFYELKINGTGVDLAYVYIPENGRWANLAMRAEVEVSDVPEFLPVKESGGGPPFSGSAYKGLIDNRLTIYMSLEKAEDQLIGTYEYASKGIPISLEGTVDADGAFTMSEFGEEDGQKTGVFIGKLSPKSERLEGSWVSPDGQKRLPFVADRFAELAEEDVKVTIKGWDIEGHLGYPKFRMKNAAAAESLTRAIYEDLRKGYNEFEKESRESLADAEPPGEGEDPSYYYDTSEYQVTHFSDSLVSISFVISSYGGGAHGNSYYNTYLYWIASDGKIKPLELKDLFKADSGYVNKLSDLLIADLKEQEAEWVMNGDIKELKAEEITSFVVTPRGLVFLFSPYAVGPYAQGPFDVEIPYSALGDVVDKEGPLKEVLRK